MRMLAVLTGLAALLLLERPDIILHHQRQLPAKEVHSDAAKRGHGRAAEQLHGVDTGFTRFVIMQAGQAQLIGGQRQIKRQRAQ